MKQMINVTQTVIATKAECSANGQYIFYLMYIVLTSGITDYQSWARATSVATPLHQATNLSLVTILLNFVAKL